MSLITCAIVEDELVSLSMIEGLIERSKLLNIKGSFSSSTKAIEWLSVNRVDLLFLDVEMPDVSGLDLLKVIPYRPDVIIVTGNPGYAINAFDVAVTDFLLKPVTDYNRFLSAVTKVLAGRTQVDQKLEKEYLFIKTDSLLQRISHKDIFWIEASGDYIKIMTVEKLHVVHSTLKNIEEKLPANLFQRVHRSYIINLERVTNIDPNNVEVNKKIIPISGTYKEELMRKINVL